MTTRPLTRPGAHRTPLPPPEQHAPRGVGVKDLRPRGHIETRPSGRFRVKVYAGDDPLTGKQNYLTKTLDTYREAEIELTKLLGQVDENKHPRTAVTVSQVVTQWLEVVELADTTRQRYEGLGDWCFS